MRAPLVLAALTAASVVSPLLAEEGMWLPNRPPRARITSQYGFDLTEAWLNRVQRSAVRFNNGGSAAFLSANGLIATNHHVGRDCISAVSKPPLNLLRDGFLARTIGEELACPGLEINVLMSIEDVTARITSAVTDGMSSDAANAARRAAIGEVEKASLEATGLRSDVVTLYRGGEYHLYRSKKYTDVRLVFAPEDAVAFFGGDTDNFEYPRYNLDIAFFRAYESGRPARTEHFLPFDAGGAKEGDLVFVVGHPGSTHRMNTVAHLRFDRDVALPATLNLLRRRELTVGAYARRSPAHAQRSDDQLKVYENARKAFAGFLSALQDPALLAAKRKEEEALRQASGSASAASDPWAAVERAIEKDRTLYVEHQLLSGGQAFHSQLFGWARTILRYRDETAKPNGERLREFHESNLESLRHGLLGDKPVHADLEIATLSDSLAYWMELTPEHPLLPAVLDGKSPSARAAELVAGTGLADSARRKALLEGGPEALDRDPMIVVARIVDARARELRKQSEDHVQEPLRQAYGAIARRRFEQGGSSVYPDATFTLRLAYGSVKGSSDAAGGFPWMTTLGGIFERAALQEHRKPFALPESWRRAQSTLGKGTPFNFATTTDIIGGNSGSPVVDRRGHWVGIVFDGNVHSLSWDFAYGHPEARAINVHAAAVAEALRVVYQARELLNELGVAAGARRPTATVR